jgi:two-component sensor histidine kinase
MHQHFISNDGGKSVSCIAFLRGLCSDLGEIVEIPILVQGDEGDVPTAHLQPIGMIVNEFVTNSAKHGAGTVEVSVQVKGQAMQVSATDDGDGLPSGFDPDMTTGLGMKVVSTLVGQLRGSFAFGANPAGRGTRFTVTFPA